MEPVRYVKDGAMSDFVSIDTDLAFAGAMSADDLARASLRGFRSIVNFRPDGEATGQVVADDARAVAKLLGMAYWHLPTTKFDVLTDGVVEAAIAAFAAAPKPVLAHCASGQRAAIVWAAAEARSGRPVAEVLNILTSAGFDFGFLQDDLEAQADRANWNAPIPDAETSTRLATV